MFTSFYSCREIYFFFRPQENILVKLKAFFPTIAPFILEGAFFVGGELHHALQIKKVVQFYHLLPFVFLLAFSNDLPRSD